MKTELYQIRKELEDRKNKIGLVGVLLNVNENEGNIISAYITTNWRTIGISYGKISHHRACFRFFNKKSGEQK